MYYGDIRALKCMIYTKWNVGIVIIEDFVYNHLCWLNDILKDIRSNKQHRMSSTLVHGSDNSCDLGMTYIRM